MFYAMEPYREYRASGNAFLHLLYVIEQHGGYGVSGNVFFNMLHAMDSYRRYDVRAFFHPFHAMELDREFVSSLHIYHTLLIFLILFFCLFLYHQGNTAVFLHDRIHFMFAQRYNFNFCGIILYINIYLLIVFTAIIYE